MARLKASFPIATVAILVALTSIWLISHLKEKEPSTPASTPSPRVPSAPATAQPNLSPLLPAPPSTLSPPTASVPAQPIAPPSPGTAAGAPTLRPTGIAISTDPDEPAQPPPPAPSQAREAVMEAMDNLTFVFRDYRAQLGGNPVGTNSEITAALLGDNIKQLKLPLPTGSLLNGEGELCDAWGTPYFFHQQSGTHMEMRSAGPDRHMWTADDLLR